MRTPLIALLLLLLLPAGVRAQTLTESVPLPDPVSGVAYDAAGFRWWIASTTTIAGKIAPDGTAVARYTQSSTGNGAGPKRDSQPAEIVAGPGGLLWFTQAGDGGGGIGRIDPTTGLFSQLDLPNSGDVDTLAEKATSGIFFEPPNTVWFTLPGVDHIGKATWSALGTTTVTLKQLPLLRQAAARDRRRRGRLPLHRHVAGRRPGEPGAGRLHRRLRGGLHHLQRGTRPLRTAQ